MSVEVAPYWNVNNIVAIQLAINIEGRSSSILECKFILVRGYKSPLLVEVAPYWNVN